VTPLYPDVAATQHSGASSFLRVLSRAYRSHLLILFTPDTTTNSHRALLHFPLSGEAPAPLVPSERELCVLIPDCSPASVRFQAIPPKAGSRGFISRGQRLPDPQRESPPSGLPSFPSSCFLERSSRLPDPQRETRPSASFSPSLYFLAPQLLISGVSTRSSWF
jgi:hypothetical protein